MSIASNLAPFFRTQWLDRMVDSVVVRRITGQTFNTSTGGYVNTYSTTYTGVALVRPRAAHDAQAGELQYELRSYDVYVPHTVTDVQPDDEAIVTSTDGFLDDRTLIVTNVEGDSYAHHRKIECEDNQGG